MRSPEVAFCIHCDRKTEYELYRRKVDERRRGVHFSYTENYAKCRCCGSEVYVSEINDANVDARLDAYGKAVELAAVDWDAIGSIGGFHD